MTRNELQYWIEENYGVTAEYPWASAPSYAVFRHSSNRKWFAVIMTVPKVKLGIREEGTIDLVNLKCSTEIIDSILKESGIYPAYHMSKAHWLSVALDGSATADAVTWLLEISHRLTAPRIRKR